MERGRKMTENSYKTPCGCIHYFVNIIDKQKITLVFLPGLTADHRLFEKQIEYFEKKQNVLVWDAPSHALSRPFTNNYSLSDMAEWLDEILTKEEIYNPIIIGQSMGGYLAQMYMELYPDKIKGFISIDSAPLQKSYMTAMEIWLLERAEPLYKIYPWKALLRAGSRGCAETEYGQKLMRKMMMSYDADPKEYARLAGFGYRMLAEAIKADLQYRISCAKRAESETIPDLFDLLYQSRALRTRRCCFRSLGSSRRRFVGKTDGALRMLSRISRDDRSYRKNDLTRSLTEAGVEPELIIPEVRLMHGFGCHAERDLSVLHKLPGNDRFIIHLREKIGLKPVILTPVDHRPQNVGLEGDLVVVCFSHISGA